MANNTKSINQSREHENSKITFWDRQLKFEGVYWILLSLWFAIFFNRGIPDFSLSLNEWRYPTIIYLQIPLGVLIIGFFLNISQTPNKRYSYSILSVLGLVFVIVVLSMVYNFGDASDIENGLSTWFFVVIGYLIHRFRCSLSGRIHRAKFTDKSIANLLAFFFIFVIVIESIFLWVLGFLLLTFFLLSL